MQESLQACVIALAGGAVQRVAETIPAVLHDYRHPPLPQRGRLDDPRPVAPSGPTVRSADSDGRAARVGAIDAAPVSPGAAGRRYVRNVRLAYVPGGMPHCAKPGEERR